MEIFILIGLIVLNGLFAMSEIALVTARKARLAKRAEEGDQAAAVAVKLGEDPTRFLSTIHLDRHPQRDCRGSGTGRTVGRMAARPGH